MQAPIVGVRNPIILNSDQFDGISAIVLKGLSENVVIHDQYLACVAALYS